MVHAGHGPLGDRGDADSHGPAGGGLRTAQSSENQLGIQGMLQQVPAWLMVPLLVLLGPFVEEYLFRHFLIGKLSRT